MDKNSSVDGFWQEKEEKLGTPIKGRTLGQIVFDSLQGGKCSLWGLFYTTSQALYFQNFPQENWFASLSRGLYSGTKKKDEDLVREIKIPWGEVKKIEVQIPQGFFNRFFRRPPAANISWRHSPEDRTMIFEFDDKAQGFLQDLQAFPSPENQNSGDSSPPKPS